MEKSVGKNYFYNLCYQVFLIIVPVLVTPYVARVLGQDASGQYSFSYSIVTYFVLFAQFGFGYYAQRTIAKFRDKKSEKSNIFWEIFLVRLIPVFVVFIVYVALICLGVFGEKYNTLMWVFAIDIFAVAFDISFYFQGMEEFGRIVVRNIFVKTLAIAATFIFIKSPSDLWLYALIQCSGILFANLFLWTGLGSMLERVKLRTLSPMRHLKPSVILFLPSIATAIYTSLDKVMIGLITGIDAENGNYEYAEKLVKMALTVITSLGAVLISKNTKRFEDGDYEGVISNIYKSVRFVFFVGVPLSLGLAAVSDNLIPWYLGTGYDKTANIIKILSPIIIIIGISNVFGVQYLIPVGKDKKFLIAIVSGAAVNVVFNSLCIYYLQSYGAAIATVIAETTVTVIMYCFLRKDLKLRKILSAIWKYLVCGLVMFGACYFLSNYLTANILNTLIIVFVGIIIYVGGIALMRDEFLYIYAGKLLLKIKKNKKDEK